jgi:hypothetical protein
MEGLRQRLFWFYEGESGWERKKADATFLVTAIRVFVLRYLLLASEERLLPIPTRWGYGVERGDVGILDTVCALGVS